MGKRRVKKHSIFAPAFRIVLPYLTLGAAWILFSDRLLLLVVDDPNKLLVLSTAKGWLYVLITGILLFWLVCKEMRRQASLETSLREGLAEKGALLAELNHRVKNNLQIIASILNLEAEDIDSAEARELNDRTRARIRSMSLAHERLFESGDFAKINLSGYLRALWDVLTEIYEAKGAGVAFELTETLAGADVAVPFGLFATEALTNAIRYGAGSGGQLDATMRLSSVGDGTIELMIRDKGPGLPEGMAGLGLRLMDALAAQLRGTVEHRNEGGAVVRLRFPSPEGRDA
jgi:two-component sensor histidine kinase